MPFTIVRNNIVSMKVDAIVNTANPLPIVGTGVDTAIHTAAGPELLEERKKIGALNVGEAVMTPAFNLDAKYVIHAIGPVWMGGCQNEEFFLRSCFLRSLELAEKAGCESIAFPLMATGNYGFPKALALRIALDVFSDFLNVAEMDIYLVVFNKEAFEISRTLFDSVSSFIDEHYVREQSIREYGHLRESRLESWDYEEIEKSTEECSSRWSIHAKHRFNRKSPLRRPNVSMASMSMECFSEEPPKKPERKKITSKKPERKKITSKKPVPKQIRHEKKEPTRLWGDSTASAVPLSADVKVPSIKKAWDNILAGVDAGFSETLVNMINARGEDPATVYKRANVDRKLFGKIRNNKDYKPSKTTAVAFALALMLDLDETKDFLARAGYALSHSNKFDVVIEFCIREKIYNIININQILFEFDLPLIGV